MTINKLISIGIIVLFALSCGEDPSSPSDELAITVTAPPSAGASAVDSYDVTWSSSSSGTVSLYYNTVASPLEQQSITSGLSASGSYSWDLSGVPDGTYFVRAIISEGASTGSDWSDGTLSVDHSGGEPGLTVTTPPVAGATADTSFSVNWVSSGYSNGTVDLFVDTDTDPSEGLIEITTGLDDTGSFKWNCKAFTEGYYFIYATITDGSNTHSSYSPGILALDHGGLNPEFYITKPPAAGATADNIYTIQWESTAPLNSTVDLYYDTNDDPSSGLIEIEKDIFDDGYYSWNCSAVPEGTYFVYGILETSTPSLDSERVLLPLRREAFRGTKGTIVTDYSAGTISIEHTGEYSIEITAPPLSGADADQSYQIVWVTDAPASEPIILYYSADTTGSELFPIMDLEPPVGTTYNWDCSGIEAGSWYIFAAIGSRGMGSDWSAGTVNVSHQEQYSFTMLTPPSAGATANENYMLNWQTSADTTAYVSLFYSETTQPGGAVYGIVSGIANFESYNWNCSSIPEGNYYVYGIVSDSRNPGFVTKGSGSDWSDGTLTIDHSGYSFNITAPSSSGEPADESYTIEWQSTASGGSVVDLYYDVDTNPSEMTLIGEGLSDSGSFAWDCSSAPEGNYFIYGIVYDPTDGRPTPGADEFAQDYSEGTVLISHEYNYITVTSPPPWGAMADTDYTIYWAAASEPGTGSVDLYYDTDSIPSSGLVAITSGLVWNDSQYFWDCSSIPAGYYYVYASMVNSVGTFTDYSGGTLQIFHDPLWFSIYAPPPPGATANDTYDLKWYSTGPDGRLMDLYYDTDTNPASGLILISENVVCTEYSTTFKWSCSSVPEGTYYIYGVLADPVSDDQYVGYSEGTLTIEH